MSSRSASVIALVLAAVLLGTACKTENTRVARRNHSGKADIEGLRRELGIAIPDDARVLGTDRESGMDDRVRAKLELSREAFDRLVPSLPIKLEELEPGAGRLGSDRGFWNPGATPGIRSGQVQLPSARYLGIGVGDASGGRVVLFAVNHGT